MTDDTDFEELISNLVVDIMLEAHEQGVTLSFKDICLMVGIPADKLDSNTENDYFILNKEFVTAIEDKEMRKNMIERIFATVH
mgnify:CR=1 FL=1